MLLNIQHFCAPDYAITGSGMGITNKDQKPGSVNSKIQKIRFISDCTSDRSLT